MYRTPEEIVNHYEQIDFQERSDMQSAIGDYCDALRGFIAVAGSGKPLLIKRST